MSIYKFHKKKLDKHLHVVSCIHSQKYLLLHHQIDFQNLYELNLEADYINNLLIIFSIKEPEPSSPKT